MPLRDRSKAGDANAKAEAAQIWLIGALRLTSGWQLCSAKISDLVRPGAYQRCAGSR